MTIPTPQEARGTGFLVPIPGGFRGEKNGPEWAQVQVWGVEGMTWKSEPAFRQGVFRQHDARIGFAREKQGRVHR
jgi:hypothetical protein